MRRLSDMILWAGREPRDSSKRTNHPAARRSRSHQVRCWACEGQFRSVHSLRLLRSGWLCVGDSFPSLVSAQWGLQLLVGLVKRFRFQQSPDSDPDLGRSAGGSLWLPLPSAHACPKYGL